MRQTSALVVMLFAAAVQSAGAAEIVITVLDHNGKPAGDAVVSLWPVDKGHAMPDPAPASHKIDQHQEAFVPFVTVMRRGDAVVFKNSDRTRHHVYSFSAVKSFELVLNPGEDSQPVKFEQSGIAAIGCNIHDKMLAYAFVTDTSWTALTDAQGHGMIAKLSKGRYRAEAWHPRMDPDRPTAEQTVVVDSRADVTFSVRLIPLPPASGHQRHY